MHAGHKVWAEVDDNTVAIHRGFLGQQLCGMFYKHIVIVNDASRVVLQIVA